jgi:hypothetical protein
MTWLVIGASVVLLILIVAFIGYIGAGLSDGS